MIKAVLFDLDGTLVNSLIDLANCVNFALEKFGFPTHKTEEFKYFAGNGIPKMLERALPQESRDAETLEKVKETFFEVYSVHYADNSAAYDGMRELVAALKLRGIKVAVITNKAQEMAEKVVLSAYGNAFDLIIGKRDKIPLKPDPTTSLMAMKELGVNADECIFIGDSDVDIFTGINCGALPVGQLWGFRDEAELKNAGAKFIISSPKELLGILKHSNPNQPKRAVFR